MPVWFEHPTDEELSYRIDEFDPKTQLVTQCHGRLRGIDAARAAYDETVKKHPGRLIVLRQNMRVIRTTEHD